MSFDPEWLALREPADRGARSVRLLRGAVDWTRRAGAAPVIVDLGCGTGSTRRAFGAEARGARWRFVDNDATLLDLAVADAGARVEGHLLDLREIDRLPLEEATLVTCSALLDLMSRDWLEGFADRLAATGAGLHAALSFDGRISWMPDPAPREAEILAAFNAHQLRDKGLGPALGPEAAAVLAELLRARGFEVRVERSDWRLDPKSGPLQSALAQGIAGAAEESRCAEVDDWLQARLAAIAAGVSSARVGHLDLLALPGGSSAQSKTTSVPRP
jgi:SAM-dependent methyltransferase